MSTYLCGQIYSQRVFQMSEFIDYFYLNKIKLKFYHGVSTFGVFINTDGKMSNREYINRKWEGVVKIRGNKVYLKSTDSDREYAWGEFKL